MDKITLKAQERTVLGKKVKKLRREGLVPAHVYGNTKENEDVTVKMLDFLKVYQQAGETGLIDLRIGDEKVRPVLIRGIQVDALKGTPLHIDFYQVNLKEKITVSVPVVQIGEEPELVHTGEAVVIQPIAEIEVEALPAELPEKFEVDITSLKQIDDVVLVSSLVIPDGVTILTDPESVVVKLDNAVTEEMQQLLEEQAAEAAAATEAAAEEEGAEGEAGSAEEGTESTEETSEAPTEEKSSEEQS